MKIGRETEKMSETPKREKARDWLACARQGGGLGRPIAEVHDNDMTNTGAEKSKCVITH